MKIKSRWPAKTQAGEDCKNCAKLEEGMFCSHHKGNSRLRQLLSIAPYVLIVALILARFLGLLPETPAWLIDENYSGQ